MSLPDGSTATARTAALATAVKSYLGGTPVDAAYRDAGIDLPPPGTPVTNPVDPSALSCGAIGMFKDHYVVALSPVKAVAERAGGAAVGRRRRPRLPGVDGPRSDTGRDPGAS